MTKVWDPFVRAFHWTLVLTFAVAWFSAEGPEGLHSAFGYAAVGLVAARAIWGFVGTRYARFSQFVRSPRETLAYIRASAGGREVRYLGHNPAGGVMIVALLIGIALSGLSGWLLTTDMFWGSEFAQSLHSVIVHLVLLMIIVHVFGVAVVSFRHNENLVRAMISGAKRDAIGKDVI